MKKILAVLFLSWSLLAQAQITTQIESTKITAGEPFKLILTLEDHQNSSIPDLSPLQKDFTILGTERRINYTLMNGQVSSLSQWTITLLAKKEGQALIPAITIGQESTKSLSIEVSSNPALTSSGSSQNAKDPASSQKEGMKLSTFVNPLDPYVNQQVIYTVKIYNNQSLFDADYQSPHIENALLFPLGEGKRYQVRENDQVYAVEEQRYAIFPQKSGAIVIHSPKLQALINDIVPRQINLRDKNVTLQVKPMPADYKGYWLPAKQVNLYEDYDSKDSSFTQGSVLTRTITLEAVASPAQWLPRFEFQSNDQFKSYSEKAKENNLIRHGVLIGQTITKITYLFEKTGEITIPEIRIPWFNTETGKMEFANLPQKTLEIKADPSGSASLPRPHADSKSAALGSVSKKPALSSQSFRLAWILAGIFAIAWLITMIIWLVQKRRPLSGRHSAYKKSLLNLHRACKENNPQAAELSLLQWAHLHWPEREFLNLGELAKAIEDMQFKRQINLLSQILYSNNKAVLWAGNDLWRCVSGYKDRKRAKKSNSSHLPPINPL